MEKVVISEETESDNKTIKTEEVYVKLEDLHRQDGTSFSEEPENTNKEIKIEKMEMELEELHHSIDIKEELQVSETPACEEVECEVCRVKCTDKLQLGKHVKMHSVEMQLSCKIDRSKFFVMESGSALTLACRMCDYKTYEMRNLAIHLNNHSDKNLPSTDAGRFEKTIRGKQKGTGKTPVTKDLNIRLLSHANENDLKNHLRTHNTPFMCEICGYKCSLQSVLDVHMQIHSDEKLPSTDAGSSKSSQRGKKKGKKPVTCKFCDYECILKKDLKIHLLTHANEKRFTCEICKYKCSQKRILKSHLLVHAKAKSLDCPMCDMKYTCRSDLRNHLRTHDTPFMCEICGYKCSLQSVLDVHLQIHSSNKVKSIYSNMKLLECRICRYRTSYKQSFENHLRNHSGDKRFGCDHCDYKSVTKECVKVHLRVHTREKPFKCKWCDFKCSHGNTLRNHLFTHTGEKPFKCEFCDYKCALKGNMNVHIRNHTGEKPYKCEICDFKCALNRSLKIHVFRYHTNRINPFVLDG